MKKVTMRDVAREAGVSVATVSYVLNNNEKESIPEETRKKVMDMVQELNYIPDLAARALTRKKSGLVGIFIMNRLENAAHWRKCFYAEFINMVIKNMFDLGYHTIVELLDPAKDKLDIIYERALDGVFLLDIDEKDIYGAAGLFKVPIILIDSYIEDTLFHKILSDYCNAIHESKRLLEEENLIIIADSKNTLHLIEKCCPEIESDNLYVAENKDELIKFLEFYSGKKFIIFNEFLAMLIKDHINTDNAVVVSSSGNEYLLEGYKYKLSFDNRKRAAMASEIMMDYISKSYHEDKFSFLIPEEA